MILPWTHRNFHFNEPDFTYARTSRIHDTK
jgi:hypothetical protein